MPDTLKKNNSLKEWRVMIQKNAIFDGADRKNSEKEKVKQKIG